MNNGRGFVMAKVRSERWGAPGMKQLVEVDEQPLLSRTFQMIKDCGIDPCLFLYANEAPTQEELNVLTLIVDTLSKGWEYATNETLGRSNETEWPLIEAMLKVYKQWEFMSGPLIFYLGDVYYSQAIIDAICKDSALMGIKFYGSDYEIFAVKIHPRMIDLEALVNKALHLDITKQYKLWSLYNAVTNDIKSFGTHKVPGLTNPYYFNVKSIDDATTQDFNTMESYNQFINQKKE